MIDSLRSLKIRIRSVENTKKITRAMEMVSSIKLNRIRNTLYTAHPYFDRLENVFNNVLSSANVPGHVLLEKREFVKKIALCIITSDAGLCGTYNHSLLTMAEKFLTTFGKNRTIIICVGKEGFNYLKKHEYNIIKNYVEIHNRYANGLHEEVKNDLTKIFLEKDADEIYIAYTHFDSTLRHRPVLQKFLNIEKRGLASGINYIAEPDMSRALDSLISRYLSEKLRYIFLNAFTSEHSARMIAMKTATDNADELIDELTLRKNKARQAAITKEVIEIASAAEALKG